MTHSSPEWVRCRQALPGSALAIGRQKYCTGIKGGGSIDRQAYLHLSTEVQTVPFCFPVGFCAETFWSCLQAWTQQAH